MTATWITATCPECGQPMDRRAKKCRPCNMREVTKNRAADTTMKHFGKLKLEPGVERVVRQVYERAGASRRAELRFLNADIDFEKE